MNKKQPHFEEPALLVGTENPGKLAEIQALLSGRGFRLVSPSMLGLRLDVPENGATYAENAAAKALAYARAGGLPAMGDDSGLEVAALGGRPGIYSHRFAPIPHATDADRRAYLLSLLRGLPSPPGLPGWPARFHCTVAVALPSGQVRFAEGECDGLVIPEERGSSGFGYDPIFYFPEFDQTMAEMGMTLKNRVSHRARAIRAAIPILEEILRTGGR